MKIFNHRIEIRSNHHLELSLRAHTLGEAVSYSFRVASGRGPRNDILKSRVIQLRTQNNLNTTIFNTPILSAILHYLADIILRLVGWRVAGKLPDLPKFVLIGAPHTSNWDFMMFLAVIFHLRARVRFMGKAELFRSPIGFFFRYCGGIPVDRSKSTGLVDQTVKAIRDSEKFILVIAPEGTRHEVTEWKRGFYHIAKGAEVPIVIAIVDGKHKEVRVGQIFHPSGNMEADMKTILGYFAGVVGINARRKYITLET
jgi:1-acyl-sn-glycerol-3-phosphate acyltransferase